MCTISQRNKDVFAKNLRYYMARKGVTQKDICRDLGFSSAIMSFWCTGKKYPRVDNMQMLADYFGILKSDLTEEKNTQSELDEYLEALRSRPEMRMLFSLTKDATKEDVEKAVKVIEAVLGK